jgi:hypothetical protein
LGSDRRDALTADLRSGQAQVLLPRGLLARARAASCAPFLEPVFADFIVIT